MGRAPAWEEPARARACRTPWTTRKALTSFLASRFTPCGFTLYGCTSSHPAGMRSLPASPTVVHGLCSVPLDLRGAQRRPPVPPPSPPFPTLSLIYRKKDRHPGNLGCRGPVCASSRSLLSRREPLGSCKGRKTCWSIGPYVCFLPLTVLPGSPYDPYFSRRKRSLGSPKVTHPVRLAMGLSDPKVLVL